ncbi:MAG: (Fe-S)-binding protein [Candidatus Heimdallarchaeota archaeon]|nr:(Fe-S)-binding protein [Candidatus Heimdallarchaeota archaeon]MCK5048844.1 (Fe-S)-binding protein [Candidatus Heimdallarchaeota archaeon]
MQIKELIDAELGTEPFICALCGYCRQSEAACPEFKLLHWEIFSPRGKLAAVKALEKGQLKANETTIARITESLYNCTMCSACSEVCLVDIDLIALWKNLRRWVTKEGFLPDTLSDLFDNLDESKNIYGVDLIDRNLWAMNIEDEVEERYNAKLSNEGVGVFFGCVFSMGGSVRDVPEKVVEVFEKLGIEYSLLGTEEWCCGNPFFLNGLPEKGKDFAEHNLAKLKEMNVKKMVTGCAGCFRVFTEEYPKITNEPLPFEVQTIAEFLVEHIKNNPPIQSQKAFKAVFKDPCELGRHCNYYEPPRELINQLPGIELLEFPHSREEAFCCGAGGLLKATNAPLTLDMAHILLEELQPEVEAIVNSCPTCQEAIEKAVKKEGIDVEVIDIIDLVLRAYQGDEK